MLFKLLGLALIVVGVVGETLSMINGSLGGARESGEFLFTQGLVLFVGGTVLNKVEEKLS